jgi:hypothetical protein
MFNMTRLSRKSKVVGIASLAAVAALTAGGIAAASSGDSDANVTGPDADKATAAALEITGGGRANSVERDTENGATWEVEVTKPDGATVDVRLDENFKLVVVEGDSEGD